MRILFITHTPLREGKGTQRFLIELGNYLTFIGNEVTLIENNFEQLKDESSVNMVIFTTFKVSQISFKKGALFYRLPVNINLDNIDLIYVASFNYLPFIDDDNIPIIFGMHVIYPQTAKYRSKFQRINFSLKELTFRLLVVNKWKRRTGKIGFHALNDEQAEWIKTITKNKYPVYVLPNPVPCDATDKEVPTEPLNNSFIILFFGSLSIGKGFATFLKLFDYLREKNNICFKESIFIAAGDGSMRNAALEYDKKYKNFRFISKPSETKKIELFKSTHVLIYPSMLDNFPYLIIEGQLLGLPVIASNVPGIREIVIHNKTGILCSVNSIHEFAWGINEYYNLKKEKFESYLNLRKNIQTITKRYCSCNVLPRYLSSFTEFLSD